MLGWDTRICEIQDYLERVRSNVFFQTTLTHQGRCKINTQVDCIKIICIIINQCPFQESTLSPLMLEYLLKYSNSLTIGKCSSELMLLSIEGKKIKSYKHLCPNLLWNWNSKKLSTRERALWKPTENDVHKMFRMGKIP